MYDDSRNVGRALEPAMSSTGHHETNHIVSKNQTPTVTSLLLPLLLAGVVGTTWTLTSGGHKSPTAV